MTMLFIRLITLLVKLIQYIVIIIVIRKTIIVIDTGDNDNENRVDDNVH